MNEKIWHHLQFLPITLTGLMALTRFDHFGSTVSLPDASLAVFFLAGISLSSPWFFTLLSIEASVIDYLAIIQFSVSDYCISPAYIFLLPTYAVMWFAGKYCKSFMSLHFIDSLKIFAWLTLATTVAFVISNGSFFLFSGRFNLLSWVQYTENTLQYYPLYLGSALVYVAIGLVLSKLWQTRHTLASVQP